MLPERFQKLKKALLSRQTDLTVVMDNVHKPHNMAAILRSCEAIGIHQAHIITPKGLYFRRPKAAAGVLRWVELERHKNRNSIFTQLKQSGKRLIAAHPSSNTTDFREYDYTQPTAIVMGSEKKGLTQEAIDSVDDLISIPMQGLVQSLNVSVSAALILFEAQRQRLAQGYYDKQNIDQDIFSKTLFEWSWPRIASACQSRNLPYPEINLDTGEIMDADAFRKLIR